MIDDKYVDQIIERIDNSNIKRKELKDDLIDHFCCLIEMDMKKGVDFEQAYNRAYEQTCPNGFDEIQRETVILLNYKLLLIMKKVTFLSGFIFSAAFTLGAGLKVLHLPGAGVLLILGMAGLVGIFLPMLIINHFKRNLKTLMSEKIQWILGSLSISMMTVGSVFKAMHWQGAGILLALGILLFVFGFLPVLFFKLYRQSLQRL